MMGAFCFIRTFIYIMSIYDPRGSNFEPNRATFLDTATTPLTTKSHFLPRTAPCFADRSNCIRYDFAGRVVVSFCLLQREAPIQQLITIVWKSDSFASGLQQRSNIPEMTIYRPHRTAPHRIAPQLSTGDRTKTAPLATQTTTSCSNLL